MQTETDQIRLYICDDSIFMRMAIKAICEDHPLIDIVGEATDGNEAIEGIDALLPDVVIMDLDMPGKDGIAATDTIVSKHNIPIIILSGLTERRSALANHSLEIGAVDVIWKSASLMDIDIGGIADTIIEKVLFWGAHPPHGSISEDSQGFAPAEHHDGILIFLGEGAPHALGETIPALGDACPPIIVVANIPSGCVNGFIRFINRIAGLPAYEALEGQVIERGNIYVNHRPTQFTLKKVAGSHEFVLSPTVANKTVEGMVEFANAAAHTFSAPLAIALSGTPDISNGLQSFADKGFDVFVQAPSTSTEAEGCNIILHEIPKAWAVTPTTIQDQLSKQ